MSGIIGVLELDEARCDIHNCGLRLMNILGLIITLRATVMVAVRMTRY